MRLTCKLSNKISLLCQLLCLASLPGGAAVAPLWPDAGANAASCSLASSEEGAYIARWGLSPPPPVPPWADPTKMCGGRSPSAAPPPLQSSRTGRRGFKFAFLRTSANLGYTYLPFTFLCLIPVRRLEHLAWNPSRDLICEEGSTQLSLPYKRTTVRTTW